MKPFIHKYPLPPDITHADAGRLLRKRYEKSFLIFLLISKLKIANGESSLFNKECYLDEKKSLRRTKSKGAPTRSDQAGQPYGSPADSSALLRFGPLELYLWWTIPGEAG